MEKLTEMIWKLLGLWAVCMMAAAAIGVTALWVRLLEKLL